MDFKQIEAFVNVAKYKSFSKAADAIFLSQPTISAHISSLEQELNMPLFDRNGKETRLTHAGSVFLEYAINMINIRNSAVLSLADFDSKVSGTLVIASSTTPCRFMLPSMIKDFYDEYPNVSFDIKEESTKHVVDMVLCGDADIGIVGDIIPDNKLSYKKIAEDNLILISNDKSLPENLSIETILKQRFILREAGSATRNIFENALKLNGFSIEKVNVLAEVSSLEAVLQFVKNGLGISIVSEVACMDYISSGMVRKHTIDSMNINRGIYSVVHTKRTLSPAGKAFYKSIVK